MIGKKIIKFREINSTNTYAKTHYKNLDSGTIIQALHQTNGYGRINRIWHDEIGKNLMFSLYLEVPINEDITMLTQMAACSVYKTLKEYEISAQIKWPNDILVNEKKICGILLESIIENDIAHIIIGIGLNINNTSFQNEICDIATSMCLNTNKKYNIDDVFQVFIKHLNNDFSDYKNGSHNYINVCRNQSFLIGKEILIPNTLETATVLDINPKGKLIIKIKDNIKEFIGSEVIVPNLYDSKE